MITSTKDVLASRNIAVELLHSVLKQGNTVDIAISRHAGYSNLPPKERSFCHHLTMTTLRYKGALSALLQQFLRKPLKNNLFNIQLCLLIGACQILLMNVPAHAAVDTSVTLAKRYNTAFAALVNAVLKQISANGHNWWCEQPIESINMPKWLWRCMTDCYGNDDARLIAGAFLQEPALDITIKCSKQMDKWQQELQLTSLPFGSMRYNGGARDIDKWPGFQQGEWWVQEVAASLPVKLMGNVNNRLVLDACAAPGGKTAQLAAAGAQVVAVDKSKSRLNRLQENLQRLHLTHNVQVVTADLLHWHNKQLFDIILLDAPCSATGTIRRNPELLWQRTAQDISRLVLLQQQLIEKVTLWLKPGGMLMYSVCSIMPQEGEEQIAKLIKKGMLVLEPFRECELHKHPELLTAAGELRILPYHFAQYGGIDGFYIARLRKAA